MLMEEVMVVEMIAVAVYEICEIYSGLEIFARSIDLGHLCVLE